MKHIVRKAFWDYEKEEKWLNEMSAKGMALTDYSFCRYVFEETQNNEYTYRIELLENRPKSVEGIKYIRFLEENGVECVATYQSWAFLRKKTSEGNFYIYSDSESRLKYYMRVYRLWSTVMWFEFAIAMLNFLAIIVNLKNDILYINLFCTIFLTILGTLFLKLKSSLKKKIKELKKEMLIRE